MIEGFARSWLALHCQTVPGLVQGRVSLRGRRELASWPEATAASTQLAELAELAAERGRPVVRSHPPRRGSRAPRSEIALPFEFDGARGALAVEIQHGTAGDAEPSCKSIVDLLTPAAKALGELARDAAARQRLVTVLEVIGSCLAQPISAASGPAVATELATRLASERVSIGLIQGNQMRVRALSHSTRFDPRAALIRDLQAAMEEAADQDASIVHPAPAGSAPRIALAHEQLVENHGAGSACSVPLAHQGKVVGAVTFERRRGQAMDPHSVRLCEDVALLLGPVLELERRAAQSFVDRVRTKLRDGIAKLRAPGNLELKVLVASLAAALLLAAFARGEYRLTADARLEGRVQRAIVAGIDGFIAEGNVRAGDLVKSGDVIGRLDDRDLVLQRRKLEGRSSQLQKEYREARAGHDRSQASILAAQMEQSEAQLNLLDEQLARTQLAAPFDGVVVKGDLSQSLGAPVERGAVLFEVAPLDGYRIILEVDERDIADTSVGQQGQLALSALPNESFGLTVERITPVSVAEDGRNYFRVEARLDEPSGALRPGMEGVGKIGVEKRRYAWIWTHKLVSWLRLWAWQWLP